MCKRPVRPKKPNRQNRPTDFLENMQPTPTEQLYIPEPKADRKYRSVSASVRRPPKTSFSGSVRDEIKERKKRREERRRAREREEKNNNWIKIQIAGVS